VGVRDRPTVGIKKDTTVSRKPDDFDYRVDGPDHFTVVADLGSFSEANPQNTPFDLPQGLQYAMESYLGGFLVTDGHHNRVLRVTRKGVIRELAQFDNIVPTGLDVSGITIFMAQADQPFGRSDDAHLCVGQAALSSVWRNPEGCRGGKGELNIGQVVLLCIRMVTQEEGQASPLEDGQGCPQRNHWPIVATEANATSSK
jgi:hypothetical protein